MASAFRSFAAVLAVALFLFAAGASAQDLSPSSAPAPSPDAGAAGSVSSPVAIIGASLVLAMLAIFKH